MINTDIYILRFLHLSKYGSDSSGYRCANEHGVTARSSWTLQRAGLCWCTPRGIESMRPKFLLCWDKRWRKQTLLFIPLVFTERTPKPQGCVLVTKHTTSMLGIFTAAGEGAEAGKGFFFLFPWVLHSWIKAVSAGTRAQISVSPGTVCHTVPTPLEVWHMSLHCCHWGFHARLDGNFWKKKTKRNSVIIHVMSDLFLAWRRCPASQRKAPKSLFRTHLASSVLEGQFVVVLGVCFD